MYISKTRILDGKKIRKIVKKKLEEILCKINGAKKKKRNEIKKTKIFVLTDGKNLIK